MSQFSRKIPSPCPFPGGWGEFNGAVFRGEGPEKLRPEKFPAPGGGVRGGGIPPYTELFQINLGRV